MICHKDVQERVSGIVQDNKRLRRSDQIFFGNSASRLHCGNVHVLKMLCWHDFSLYCKCSRFELNHFLKKQLTGM